MPQSNSFERDPSSLDYLSKAEKAKSTRDVASVATGIIAVPTIIVAAKANWMSDQLILVGSFSFLTSLGAFCTKSANDEFKKFKNLFRQKLEEENRELNEFRSSEDPTQQQFEHYSHSLDSAAM